MYKLADTAPEVYQTFIAGKFVVKRTHKKFNAVCTDMALEQTISMSQKSASGTIGNIRWNKFVAKWEIIHHEMLAIQGMYYQQGNRKFNPLSLQ